MTLMMKRLDKPFQLYASIFKDSRYMSENNKPLMVIYIPNLIRKLNKMLDLWTKMAKDAGFDGLTYIYQSAMSSFDPTWDRSKFDYGVEMNPGYVNLYNSKNKNISMPWILKYSHQLKKSFI